MIMKYIEAGLMYSVREGENIKAAVALVPFQDDEYRGLEWGVDA